METAATTPRRTTRVVQTPGEPAAPVIHPQDVPDVGAELPGETAGAPVDGGVSAPVVAGGTVTISAEQFGKLMSMMSVVQQQGAEIAALKRSGAAAAHSAPAPTLPTVDEVLAAKPAVPTLSREGWVVPESGPLNPKRTQL